MAEEEEVQAADPKPYLEIICKSSGNVRRFAMGTEARFAVQLINRKLDSGNPLALYIEAVKQGEEPISFGPTAVLADYGDAWKLHTVLDEDFEKLRGQQPTSNVIETGGLKRSTSSLKGDISFQYFGRILMAFTSIVLLGVFFTLFLENLPRLILFVTSSM